MTSHAPAVPPDTGPRRARLDGVAWATGAWLLAYLAWSLSAPPFDTLLERTIDDAAALPLRTGIAALALWLGRAGPADLRARRGFTWLGWAFALGAVANLLRTAMMGTPLSPAFGLAVAIPQGVLTVAGLWQLAEIRQDRDLAADWLDAAVIVLASYLLAVHFIAGGDPFDPSHLGGRRWLFIAYLAADVLGVFLAATAWFRKPDGLSRDALGLLVLGFGVIGIADLRIDQLLQADQWLDGGVLDFAIALGFGLILLGLDNQRRHPSPSAELAHTRAGRHIVAPIAILAATVPMLQLVFEDRPRGSHLAFHVIGIVVLISLVLWRQHLDRTRLMAVAQERADADARFRSLVQRSSDAILEVGTDHVVRWASPSASEMAGTIPALLVGRRIADLAHPEDRDRIAVFLANASQPFARNAALRWRLGRADQWYEVESVVTDLTADPAVGAFVLNTRNVTERVRLEQQLRQAQKLEAVGRLAGGIAHDFNNILAAIITHAQLVRDGLPPGDGRAEDLLEIEQTAQRGAALTRRLLSFSRPEAGELQVHSLPTVIRGMEPLLRRLLVGQVELSLELGADDLWVRTAEGQVEQILMNLAINARDAMPDGGTVHVRTRGLTVRPGATDAPGVLPGRWAELVVHDSGVGMDAETLARLFEPFFTTKPSGLGTGLGLTTVRGIVRSLGGHVLAASAPAKGTTMRVLLPLAPAAEQAPPPPRLSPAIPERVRRIVMIVDDEAALRNAMQRFLERSGYAVLAAGTALDALQELAACDWKVDLVVTDMVMPGLGGREFVRRLRELQPALPVLCMSGHMEWEAGGEDTDPPDAPWRPDRLLAKPFSFPDLLLRVRDAITPQGAAV